ncbi:DedA family protein [Frigidibacter oleivorans]|uniref:DedA family protein n=1 Tax=Frigidibacter oleivorans TaxID=2487129 RepID=UPI000F8D646E|nr:DedA family protein [Frigidibacter oleivorans]
MPADLPGLLSGWGPGSAVLVLGIVTFLSCLMLPVPASLAMLTAGGLAAAGQLPVGTVAASALAGAVLGDQAGYWAGRRFGAPLLARLSRRRGRAALILRAEAWLLSHGAGAVFFSRWLLSPLGPWVNLATGAGGFGWRRFTLWAVTGEAVWVALYVGLGHLAADSLPRARAAVGQTFLALGLLAGLALLAAGLILWRRRGARSPS